MGKLTRKMFHEIVQDHSVLVPQHVIDSIYIKVISIVEDNPAGPNAAQRIIATYAAAYKQRYGTNPAIGGLEMGIAKSLVKDMTVEALQPLIGVYLQMDDAYFRSRYHDLTTFKGNLNKIKVRHETGRSVTQTEVRTDDRAEANKNAARNYLEDMEKSEHGGET